MPAPTKAEVRTAMQRFKTHPNLEPLARRHIGNTLDKIQTALTKPDAEVQAKHVARAVSWLRTHWDELTKPQKAAIRARLAALRTSATASDDVKAFLSQAMRRFQNIGDDDTTVLDRLAVVIALPADQVDPDELEQLLNRAKAFWDTQAT